MRVNDIFRAKPAFPAWAGPAERLRYLLRYATRAPSRHNAQPWLFEIDGPELRVYVDPRRALKSADPVGREATMACGAAVENLCLAAAWFGHQTDVKTRDPGHEQPIAVVRLAGRRHPTPAEAELFAAIPRRRTALAFREDPVEPEDLAALAGEVGADAALRRIPRWLARQVSELVAEADAVQWASARFRTELALWTRHHPRRLEGLAPDPRRGAARPGRLLRRLLLRAGRWGAELDRRCDHRTRTMLLLSTRDEGPREWLGAGRAMQRLLLRATARGLSVAFLSQPIEVPDLRRRLRREVGEPGFPQLLLRVGYGLPVRAAPRRPVELVLRRFSTDRSHTDDSLPEEIVFRRVEI
jgi:nitroreductase